MKTDRGLDMNWKYIKTLINEKNIIDFEALVNYTFPNLFKECILKNNGGRPDKRGFNTESQNNRELKTFLSFNHDDKETVWKYFEWNKADLANNYVPFAIDNFGNLICFSKNDSHIVFWNHEESLVEYIAEDFRSFLENLFE